MTDPIDRQRADSRCSHASGRGSGGAARLPLLLLSFLVLGCGSPAKPSEATPKAVSVNTASSQPTSPNLPEVRQVSEVELDDGRWTENFDTLDASRWSVEFSTFGDPESQHCYLPENVAVADGSLLITARAGEVRCDDGTTRPYSSGMIQSQHRVDWTYGEFEIEARFPTGAGLWPAIWMSPTERTFGRWPRSGEIDIIEVLGDAPEVSVCSIHYWDPVDGRGANSVGRHLTTGSGLHTYGLRWTPTELVWTVDGDVCHRVDLVEIVQEAVFAEPFYLRVNLAVGGKWPGPPDPAAFPATMEVTTIEYRKLEPLPE